MPISLEWVPAQETWTFTVLETFTFEEIHELVEKTDWRGARSYLWDLRDLVQGPDSSGELRGAAAWVKRSLDLWRDSRVAIVVARDVDFGIARMFQAFAADIGVEYQIFREYPEALAWLENAG